jgi:hypothetical protein
MSDTVTVGETLSRIGSAKDKFTSSIKIRWQEEAFFNGGMAGILMENNYGSQMR